MKREKNLDFTSLLDVIMILLFIVLSGIGRRAQTTEAELKKAESRAQATEAELKKAESRAAVLSESVQAYEEEIAQLSAENIDLNTELDAVLEQYTDLKTITDYGSGGYQKAYPAVLRRVAKSTIVCLPEPEAHSDRWNVRVDLYIDRTYDNSLVYTDTYTLIHDYDLSPYERRRANARQELEMTKFLETCLMQDEEPMEYCYITIQYPAGDENFSSLDLDIIERAISNIQNERGLKCYIEKAGIF